MNEVRIGATAPYDLLLIDLCVPDSKGLDTFERVKGWADRVPIVVQSGIDDEAVAVEVVRRGAQDYLVKDDLDAHDFHPVAALCT